MNSGPSLDTYLDELSAGLNDGSDLGAILEILIEDVSRAVPSFLALQLTVAHAGAPLVLTTANAEGTPARASLLLPLDQMGIAATGANVVYYAATPGAFRALAVTTRQHYGLHEQVVLDAHLVEPGPPALAGLEESSMVNQAVGVLIHAGHTPEAAHDLITRSADRTTQTHLQAARKIIAAHTAPIPS